MTWQLPGGTLAILLVALPAAGWAQAADQPVCQTCHADKFQSLKASAHGFLACTTCHVGYSGFPHPTGVPKPQCSQCHAKEVSEYAQSVHGVESAKGNTLAPTCEVCHGDAHTLKRTHTWEFKKSFPDLCGGCHAGIAQKYHQSIHGQGLARGVVDVPVCTTCHSAHLILAPTNPGSTVYPTHIRETCGQCHGNVRLAREYGLPANRLLTYDASFHGMMAREGSVVVANCASCHGIHLILPSSDPRSSINPKNLPKTCGKCHAGAGTTFAIGPVHELPGGGTGIGPVAIRWVRLFYWIVIPLTIGLMFLHNLGDWLRKLRRVRFAAPSATALAAKDAPAQEKGEIRMFGFERFQHFLLLSSFITLVWTGFALKYPTGWWAAPLLNWEAPGRPLRGIIHRIAAVVFMTVAVMHVISLVKSERLRRHWKSLWPVLSDVREGFEGLAYNLGLRATPPQLPAHTYIEKAEYWAVVWGTVIMSATGVMLWGHNFVLKWLPKVFLDLVAAVHLYEAILAALAILVWHFYSVIFDPEVYPMDAAWLTGRSPRRRTSQQGALAEPAAIEPEKAVTNSEPDAPEPNETETK